MREVNARFMAAALAEDGMPISVGWWPPVAEPPAQRADAPNRDEVASAPG